MDTKIIRIKGKKRDTAGLKSAAETIERGGVVVFPTDTVYGLAASAFNARAQARIYQLKGRSCRKPLIIMGPDIESLSHVVEVSAAARRLMERFWPGPLTLVLPTTVFGRMMMGGRTDAGVRIPDDPVARRLLSLCSVPLATTSANPSSDPGAKSGREAAGYFDGKVDAIIDAGCCRSGRESTVIDMLRFPYVVLREGCLPSKKLLDFI